MKSQLSLVHGLLFCLPLLACTSTETGNPAQPESPTGKPFLGSSVSLQVGLMSPPSNVAIAANPAQLTQLWMQISEVEVVPCDGSPLTSDELSVPGALKTPTTTTIQAPDDPVCALLVRTTPLDATNSPDAPLGALGQGAFIEALDGAGQPVTVAIPTQTLGVLTPLVPTLTLKDAADLRLLIDQNALVASLLANQPPQIPTIEPATAPDAVAAIAAALSRAFRLVEGSENSARTLASSEENVALAGDLLCSLDCSIAARTTCPISCNSDACLSDLSHPECGTPYQELLMCRISLNPSQLEMTCDTELPPGEAAWCDTVTADWTACVGK